MELAKLSLLKQVRALLRAALQVSEISEDPLIWAQVGQAFGHVCNRIRLYDAGDFQDIDSRRSETEWHVSVLDQRRLLKETILEAIVAAQALGEQNTASHLNSALRSTSNAMIPTCSAND